MSNRFVYQNNQYGGDILPCTLEGCIDASRISYAPRREDIYFIDNDKLFNK